MKCINPDLKGTLLNGAGRGARLKLGRIGEGRGKEDVENVGQGGR